MSANSQFEEYGQFWFINGLSLNLNNKTSYFSVELLVWCYIEFDVLNGGWNYNCCISGEADLSRYTAEILAKFMYVMYYEYVFIYSPNLSDHDYVSHEDYKDSILLGLAPKQN